MTEIVGISGSLRKASLNSALLRAAAELSPVAVHIASIREVPLYDGDWEAEHGLPPAVLALKDRVAASAGLLLVSPEYNNGMPGVLKNAIDWMSRGGDLARVFGDRPVAVMGATPGRGGTLLGQNAWLPVLRTLGTRLWTGGRMTVSEAHKAFDPEGHLIDEKLREQIRAFMAGFVAFATR